MRKTLYIGEFPPPFGGVTVKNQLLRDYIYNSDQVQFFNLYDCKKNRIKLVSLLHLIQKAKCENAVIVLGIGYDKRLERMLQMIYLIGKEALIQNCLIIMMGSKLQTYCKGRTHLINMLRKTKCILTESHKIEKEFQKLGIQNVDFFPNCRVAQKDWLPKKRDMEKPIKMVFFSKICEGKGVTILFEAVQLLKQRKIKFQLDFYGVLDPDYRTVFEEQIEKYSECQYYGVFDTTKQDVYAKLHEYDVLAFPTMWKGEGVAGILVESKIAGIPAIVTDHRYNDEVVQDGVEGILIEKNSAVAFADAVAKLDQDPELLFQLATGAHHSRMRYDIMTYKEHFLKFLQ